MIHMNNIFYIMKDTVKNNPLYETKNPTINHYKFLSNEPNHSEIKYQCNDIYIDCDSFFSFENAINCNGNIIDNLSDNNAQTFEHQNNMTQRENVQVEIKKEEEENIKEEKIKKNEKKSNKKRKRYKSKENNENKELYPKKIFETKIDKENQKK